MALRYSKLLNLCIVEKHEGKNVRVEPKDTVESIVDRYNAIKDEELVAE